MTPHEIIEEFCDWLAERTKASEQRAKMACNSLEKTSAYSRMTAYQEMRNWWESKGLMTKPGDWKRWRNECTGERKVQ